MLKGFEKVNGFQKFLYFAFYAVFCLSFAWIIEIVSVGTVNKGIPVTFALVAGFFLLFFIAVRPVGKIIGRTDNKRLDITFAIMTVMALGFMILIGFKTEVAYENTWDYGKIIRTSMSLAKNDGKETFQYFARYPNNLMILYILEVFFSCVLKYKPNVSPEDLLDSSVILNCIFIIAGVVFLYLAVRKRKSSKTAFAVAIVTYLSAPLWMYSPIFYSDTVGLPFMTATLFFYECARGRKGFLRYLYAFLAGAFAFAGFKVKASIIFVLAGIFADIIISNGIKNIIKFTVPVVLSAAMIIPLFSYLPTTIVEIDDKMYEEYRFPYTHWIMMSLNKDGGYVWDDVRYTEKFKTEDEKTQANIRQIKSRILKRGFGGTVRFVLVNKVERTWVNGDMDGLKYLGMQLDKTGTVQKFILHDGEYYNMTVLYTQSYHLAILLFTLLGAVMSFRKKERGGTFAAYVALFAVAAFLLIWECNPRYLYTFIPMFSITAVDGMEKIYKKIR